MTQHWKKLGRLYVPKTSGQHPKLTSHAANPLPVHLAGDTYRVFFSGRDEHNRSSVGAVDIDIVQRKVITEHFHPFFEHGPAGSFFADGVSIANCYEADGVRYMLFMGWQAPSTGHWRGDIGRLVVSPELLLTLDSDEPFMGSDSTDPISLSYPWVIKNSSGGFNMWYGSTQAWDAGNGEMLHTIQHASSERGDRWNRTGLAVPYVLGEAQAFSRPTVVLSSSGKFCMWFSYRGNAENKYRIGFAESADGVSWSLALDKAGISVSDTGWDSEMVEYPFVFSHKGQTYLLYNGNGYGKSGFGLAILDD
ncbi:hypothetical protein LPB72_16560 [Hydrogenophaga crassostreae]|uniref:Glycosyl hydrolase family 32 N-terminal domain-containing protein n=1 Tax=Hydrogenophaga crassostreae TaxID=1763535 RepID=A0A167H903_9BURK|nr:hypothetical protein [Hydrogenophaga crassostreae]AOW12641.1 hypothetical protein LPB072_07075 [Hydrogenophaga crassostreae]OAD40513.1 hypothetical protein LPB72_16560 [Hydrogenophaga crassostreae]